MKTIYTALSVLALMSAGQAYAQNIVSQPFVKKIEVSGSAEMEVTPDEIYINIALREYFTDKSNKTKVAIETLEKQLQQAVNEAAIPKENFQIENIYGGTPQWWYDRKKDKPANLLESKRYVLKVSDLSKIDNILARVDGQGVENVNINRYTHSKMSEFRKELKIKALQAAKEKAAYLLQSIGEQVGGVLEIREIDNPDGPVPYRMSNMVSQTRLDAADSTGDPDIGFRKIKVRYEMQASFAIK